MTNIMQHWKQKYINYEYCNFNSFSWDLMYGLFWNRTDSEFSLVVTENGKGRNFLCGERTTTNVWDVYLHFFEHLFLKGFKKLHWSAISKIPEKKKKNLASDNNFSRWKHFKFVYQKITAG